MNEHILSQYTITNFKRKRKPDVTEIRYNNVEDNNKKCKRKRRTNVCELDYANVLNMDVNGKKYKRALSKGSQKSSSDSSNSTTPLYGTPRMIKREMSLNDTYSSEENSSIISRDTTSLVKIEANLFSSFPLAKSEFNNRNNIDNTDQDTFRVDIGRYQSFTRSSKSTSSFLNTDFRKFNSPLTKNESPSSPMRVQRNRRNRNNIYKPHKHNKTAAVPLVPCKGPACTSQICCAQYCSQRCFTNQMQPIGSGFMKNSALDFDNGHQTEIKVTDYGLPYPDHTYCRNHRNEHFIFDPSIDSPPYCELVEELFYDEKEVRIKNPRPEPNVNGDPISSNGCISQTGKRGRPKRSNVIGLLDPYIFHPSTDVVYTPFLFKEAIIKADELSKQLHHDGPIRDAIRQCTNLYRDVRADVPPEVIYAGGGGGSGSGASYQPQYQHHNTLHPPPSSGGPLLSKLTSHLGLLTRDDNNAVIDDLFEQDDDDDDTDDDDDDSYSMR